MMLWLALVIAAGLISAASALFVRRVLPAATVAVLDELRLGWLYGRDIADALRGRRFWLARGYIYIVLSELQRAGLVDSVTDNDGRRCYRLTERGLATFDYGMVKR